MADDLSVRSFLTKAAWGIASMVGGAILAWVGYFAASGGVVRTLGGFSVSQLTEAIEYQVGTNCGDYRNAVIGSVKKSFCFLSDISIRQDNAGGWDVCKIEVGNGDNAGKLLLTAQMTDGTCAKGAEISCKARCINF
jgi:hypothetical protein